MLRSMTCRGLVLEASTKRHYYTNTLLLFGVLGHLESHAPSVHDPPPPPRAPHHSGTTHLFVYYTAGLFGCGTGLGTDGDGAEDAGMGTDGDGAGDVGIGMDGADCDKAKSSLREEERAPGASQMVASLKCP